MGKRYRLVRRQPDPKTGLHKVASSSDGIVDVAAMVECGLITRQGLPELLPPAIYERARKLLTHNRLAVIQEKRTPRHELAWQRKKNEARAALATVIGPLYGATHQNAIVRALNMKRFLSWLQAQLREPGSTLNCELIRRGYDELVELQMSDRWWADIIAVRKESAE
jgi:hypothetical protein